MLKPPVGRADIPKALGRFRIEALLGGGSFGTVYRAFDPLVGEQVALKVLRPELSKDNVQMERLRREVVLARKVDHPGVCRIHDLHQDGETLFVVMELIDGETLDALCARGPLAPARATRIIEDVCRALSAAHDVGVLHRDIKPSNVMVRAAPGAEGRDEVTLVDFGIATTQGLEHLTRPGVALGTVGYLAPELWDGEDASPASDVFAAGVMLYGALTSKMPWRAAGLALAQQMRSVKPVPPSMFAAPGATDAPLDARLDAIVLQAIAVDARDRYDSARAFADALRAWRDSPAAVVAGARVSTPPARADAREPEAPRDTAPTRTRSRALPVAALALAGIAFAAAGYAVTRAAPTEGPPKEVPPVVARAPLELTRPIEPPPEPVEPTPTPTPAPTPADGAAVESDVDAAVELVPTRVRPAGGELAGKMVAARGDLVRAMKERGLVPGDVPAADSALRSRLGGARAVANLEAALVVVKATSVDRAFVERKLARLQARASGQPPNAQLDALAAGIAADIGARKYVEANARLNQALVLVRVPAR